MLWSPLGSGNRSFCLIHLRVKKIMKRMRRKTAAKLPKMLPIIQAFGVLDPSETAAGVGVDVDVGTIVVLELVESVLVNGGSTVRLRTC